MANRKSQIYFGMIGDPSNGSQMTSKLRVLIRKKRGTISYTRIAKIYLGSKPFKQESINTRFLPPPKMITSAYFDPDFDLRS